MPSVYDFKPRFQNMLRPRAEALVAAGASANQVTLAAAGLSILTGGSIALWPGSAWPLLLLPPVLFARMALNALDGMMAREHGQATALGALLNELGDVVSDAALYLPLALVPGVPAGPLVVVVVLGLIGEMTGVLALTLGAARRYDGPLGKSDRALAFGALALLLGLGVPTGAWLDAVVWVLVALSGATVANRARKALRSRAP
ncbi:MAG: CDP-alcohol phosphatidyltransferase family protein [Proteobacteria bacterium]|nr:CDP-alcohol phosphatidyltransferase family protein [Pseudomonadota bacterium]